MIKLSFIFALFLYSSFSHSATVPLDFSSGWTVGSLVGQNKTLSMQKSPVIVFQSTDTNKPNFRLPSLPVQVPTSRGDKMVNLLNVTKNVTASALGSTAAKLMKTLPYVGTAIAVGDLFCQVTNVCHLPHSGTSSTDYTPQVVTHYPAGKIWASDSSPSNPNRGSDATAVCTNYYSSNSNVNVLGLTSLSTTEVKCHIQIVSSGTVTDGLYLFVVDTFTAPADTSADATPQQLSDAYAFFDKTQFTLSNMNLMAHFLVDNKSDVPVDPADIPTQVFLIPFEGTVIRDGSGNVTGSSESTGEITVVKGSEPDTVVTTETVKTTNKTADGTVISSSVVSKGGPPSDTTTPSSTEPPKYPTVEIDDVKDVDLPTYQAPSSFTTTSWGESSCPPDPVVHTQLGNLTVPVSRVCYWVGFIRPGVILMAFILAGFIISGRKND